jgi:glycine cleavage system H protein
VSSPNDRKYTSSHEWVKISGNSATVGISEFAVHAIKDIVFLELPAVGKTFEKLKAFGVIESVKAVFDLNCPMEGTVSQVNSAMMDEFETLAKDPYEKGWLIKIDLKSTDTGHLMDSAAYDRFCAEEHH